jgi:hypothetical protein
MTWLWITVFVLVCTVPMAGYIYLIEVRDHPDPSAVKPNAAKPGSGRREDGAS